MKIVLTSERIHPEACQLPMRPGRQGPRQLPNAEAAALPASAPPAPPATPAAAEQQPPPMLSPGSHQQPQHGLRQNLWAHREAWSAWRGIALNYSDWVAPYVPLLRRIPPALHERLAAVTQRIAEAIYIASTDSDAEDAFLLLLGHHRLLLGAPMRRRQGSRERHIPRPRAARWELQAEQYELVAERLELFESGNWQALLDEVAQLAAAAPPIVQESAPADAEEAWDLELGCVLQLIRAGECRRAVQRLTSLGVTPGNP